MVEYVNASGYREYVGTPAIRDGLLNIGCEKLPIHLNANLSRQLMGA